MSKKRRVMGSRAWRRNKNARKLASSRYIGVQVAGNSPPVCPRLPRNIKPPVPPLNLNLNHSAPWSDLHQPHTTTHTTHSPVTNTPTRLSLWSPHLNSSSSISPSLAISSSSVSRISIGITPPSLRYYWPRRLHVYASAMLSTPPPLSRADSWQFSPDSDFKTLNTTPWDPQRHLLALTAHPPP